MSDAAVHRLADVARRLDSGLPARRIDSGNRQP
jgi:hypothetical protein